MVFILTSLTAKSERFNEIQLQHMYEKDDMEKKNSTLVKYPLQIQQKYLTIPICSCGLQRNPSIDTFLYITTVRGHSDIMSSLNALNVNVEISGKIVIVQ
jgi:hypothetical protein